MNKERIKSWRDYICYVVKHDKFILIASIIDVLLLGYALSECDIHEPSSWVIFGIVLINLLWQVYNVWSHWSTTIRKVNYSLSEIPIIDVGRGANYLLSNDVQKAYAPIPTIPQYIELRDGIPENFIQCREPIKVQIAADDSRRMGDFIQAVWSHMVLFLNEELHRVNSFYNEKKLCMSSEVCLVNNEWMVRLCEGEYYDSFLTNSVFNRYLKEKKSGIEIFPIYNAKNYVIPLLHDSRLNNHIGVSTLILSSDDKTYLLRQNSLAVENREKVVPTGSGSVDYSDAEGLHDLRQIISKAAERELREETTFDSEAERRNGVNVETTIIGYYRDLSRGGKPEFCCITRVGLPAMMLEGKIKPQEKEQYQCDKYPAEIHNLCTQGVNEANPSATLKANIYFLAKYMNK